MGQNDTHIPHPLHKAGSMAYLPPLAIIAAIGHAPAQAPQLTQFSVIL